MKKSLLIRKTRNIKGFLVFSSTHGVYEAMHSDDSVTKNEQFMILRAKKGQVKKIVNLPIVSLALDFFGGGMLGLYVKSWSLNVMNVLYPFFNKKG